MKLVKMFLVVAMVMGMTHESWARARWDKILKLTGFYSGSSAAYTATGGLTSNLTRWGLGNKWVNGFGVSYGATEAGKSASSYWQFTEEYQRDINSFTSWKFYLGISDWGIDDTDIGSESTLTLERKFSRYLTCGAGLRMTKTIKPDMAAATSLRLNLAFIKSYGYRTYFSIAPLAFNFSTANLSEFTASSTMQFKYVFGKRFSLEVTATPGYNSVSKTFDSGTSTVKLNYDVFNY